MIIESRRSIAGPNVWSRAPVTEFQFNLGPLATLQPEQLRLMAGLLTDFLIDDLNHPGFELDPHEPLPFESARGLVDLVGTLILDLQRLTGFPVSFLATPATAERTHKLVVEHQDDLVVAAAGDLAVQVVNGLASGEKPPGVLRTEVVRFGTITSTRQLLLNARPAVVAARARGIPVSRFDPTGRIIELGNGSYRRRLLGSVTSRTSIIGESIVESKFLTNLYLRSAGLPVPDSAMSGTADQALATASQIGYPVVIKPVDAGGSMGVTVDVPDDAGVREAFQAAVVASPSRRVLVERYVIGNQYRATVIDGQISSVQQRVPVHVVGDGRQTVRQLIDLANSDPRRGRRDRDTLRLITVNERMMAKLARQDLSLDSIPAAGRRVVLQPTGIGPGTYTIDRTDEVHPDNAAIILQAVRVLDLDVATVDLVAHDIAESIGATSGAIIELNTRSGFRAEIYPAEGSSRDPGPAFIQMLFPPGRPVRAPIIAVAGEPHVADVVTRLIARVLIATGSSVGQVSTSGLVIDGRRIRGVATLDPSGIATVLNNPATEAVVAQIDAAQVIEHGLGFDYCDVAVVLSLSGLTTPFAKPVETVLTEWAAADGVLVLNGDDPATACLALNPDRSPVLFGLDAETERMRDHLRRGGKGVAVRRSENGEVISLIETGLTTDLFPATTPAIAADLPEEWSAVVLLAAVAAAVARGLALEPIRRTLG